MAVLRQNSGLLPEANFDPTIRQRGLSSPNLASGRPSGRPSTQVPQAGSGARVDYYRSIKYIALRFRRSATTVMQNRRTGERHVISFPIRLNWKDDEGKELMEEGLTENVGPNGALVYLPRLLPEVGTKVTLTVTENPKNEVSVTAEVLRLERNAAHPQAALQVTKPIKLWKKKVWEYAAAMIESEKPEEFDDW